MTTRKRALIFSIAVIIALPVSFMVLYPRYLMGQETARQGVCREHLKAWSAVFARYAADHAGRYPPLAPYDDLWAPDLRVLYPDYIADLSILKCPSTFNYTVWLHTDTAPTADAEWRAFHEALSDYVYLGYAATNVEDLKAIADARPQAPPDSIHALSTSNTAGASSPEEIPVMFDGFAEMGNMAEFNHIPGGANVLYLDGHVEYVRCPARFPVTKAASQVIDLPMT